MQTHSHPDLSLRYIGVSLHEESHRGRAASTKTRTSNSLSWTCHDFYWDFLELQDIPKLNIFTDICTNCHFAVIQRRIHNQMNGVVSTASFFDLLLVEAMHDARVEVDVLAINRSGVPNDMQAKTRRAVVRVGIAMARNLLIRSVHKSKTI